MQRGGNPAVGQNGGLGIKHLRVFGALGLIEVGEHRIVQHAVLAIATLQFQRGSRHRFTATNVSERSTVGIRRPFAQRRQAFPCLPGQHQQGQQHQQKGH